jgi:hypothetical protein
MSAQFEKIHAQAHAAGMAALAAVSPVPMVVVEAGVLSGAPLPGAKQYYVEGGVCGFAWVSFAGNIPFGRWAKKAGIASSGYPKGLQVWVGEGGQSMERKEAYASAYAMVLRQHGIAAYANSRMD